jgi:hypothetical protein
VYGAPVAQETSRILDRDSSTPLGTTLPLDDLRLERAVPVATHPMLVPSVALGPGKMAA